jgi:UPF0716 protein FxsA
MPALSILFVLLAIPILEITVFILVGGQIGVPATLAMILVTAVIGTIFLRQQGLSTIRRIQQAAQQNQLPADALVDGLMIAIAGILLLTPGFVTDTLGFLLFVPLVRRWLVRQAKSRINVVVQNNVHTNDRPSGPSAPKDPGGGTIDLDDDDYHVSDPDKSPWRN